MVLALYQKESHAPDQSGQIQQCDLKENTIVQANVNDELLTN